MRPTRQFNLTSEIPDSLAALPRLAANLHWAWDGELASIFDQIERRSSPRAWRHNGQHPTDLIRRTTPDRWIELAADAAYVSAVDAAAARLDRALSEPTWFDHRASDGSALRSIAYFSPEFGITEALPQYSGGLGVLAGDHLKASSDLGIPLIGVGLLYSEGYFRQEFSAEGWQEERNDTIDPNALGLVNTGIVVHVDLAGVDAAVQVWRVDVGRVPLYLLDTNVADNPPDVVAVTNRLYGGDEQHRLRQEIVLGIGGVRALRALDLHPQVFHMNEGHAGFLGLERAREWVERGLEFTEAIEAVRAGGVFTTHTPVPAGIDRFPRDLFQSYFESFAPTLGIEFDELFALGERADEPDGKFNMAVMGLRLASRRNGVAALHGAVARTMFSGMWPDLPAKETPIGHITNGVHARSWVSDRVDRLMSEVVGEEWHLAEESDFANIDRIDAGEIWAVRRQGRQELVELVRDRLGSDLLDPDVLTIGFARRFATYKRANLLLSQMDRLKALLLHADRPVQFVFAGKAHPADHPGKTLMQQIQQVTRDAEVRHRFVFIPGYDIGIARTMYHGCDVWLNTPRRPMEACGTSGMKAALNGVLNCSILDGWWDEMSDGLNGFDLPSFDDDRDDVRRDQREANATFDVLERELVPLFYDNADDGLPHAWIDRIKHNWTTLGWNVTAGRMVRDYTTKLYEPAAAAGDAATADDAAPARELAAWRLGVTSVWDTVSVQVDAASDVTDGPSGQPRTITATVDPGKLRPDEIVVQVVHGPLDASGVIDDARSEATPMVPTGAGRFAATFTPVGAGPWGVAVRAMPTHAGLSSIAETGLIAVG
jgi:starch phosphorylase